MGCLKCGTLALVVVTAILTACGGGTGSSGSSHTTPPPPPATYKISGTVTGLAGTGLVLQNNGNTLPVSANGNFTFGTALKAGSSYSVSVLTQPANPSQTCTVTNATGTVNADVTTVAVSCTTTISLFTIGVAVSGLSGSGLVLQNNGGDDLAITANTVFTFVTKVPAGSSYNVTVKTQPSNPAQTCAVTNGSDVANEDVSNVSVSCSTTTYKIGGTVSGLAGTGLVLQNNGGDNLAVSGDGSFQFVTGVPAGSSYSVKVATQPTNPTQTCSVSNAGGIANADVASVTVTCSTTTYRIGGTLSGLTSGTVQLEDNGGDALSLTRNGSFNFNTLIASGGTYSVAVSVQPAGQYCSVANASGTVTAAVTNVEVSCAVSNGNTIGESFFGVDLLLDGLIWPPTDGLGQIATFGSMRLWDDKVKWGQVNTADGVYDWTQLDSWISMAQSQNADVLYTFGDTPDFAGTIPKGNVHCLTPSEYSCSPPNDVNADGTGADKYFSDFVTALVTRYKGQISYYELWNEPDCPCYFAGTQAQMVRMNTDAAAIIRAHDPNAKLLSPSGHVWTMETWFDPYIAAGGAATFDIVNMHMRGNGPLNDTPEAFLGTYANVESDLVKNKVNNLPLWDSEHGIKAVNTVTDPDELAGYVVREVALRAGLGIPRQYLYAWDDTPPVGEQGNLAGTAWDTVAGWLIGHSIKPCVATGTVYTCDVDDGQIVWDTAQTCSTGACTTSNYTYPSSYAFETDLTGKRTALIGKTVPIGYKPIFLTAR